jgi:hypothetical protein
VAAGSGLSTGLSTAIKYVRRTESGDAGNGFGTTAKYLRRTRNGAVGSGLGTTIKYRAKCLCVLKILFLSLKKQSCIT